MFSRVTRTFACMIAPSFNCAVMAWACNNSPGVAARARDGWARVSKTFSATFQSKGDEK